MAEANRSKAAEATSAKRKLAAILHADVAGYSRLMGQDEVGTHDRLMAFRRAIDALIGRHHGRVVGTAGDAVLADFPSVVEALAAAVDIQNALAERNADLPVAEKLEFRIGINLGDVIVEGDDIFGDGVNVAARLQGLALPGGIAVSGAVYDQVKGKIALNLRDQGTQRVKNIADPIRVYAVDSDGGDAHRAPAAGHRRRLTALVAGVAALLLAAGGAVWLVSSGADDRDLVGESVPPDDTRATNPAPATEPGVAGKPTIGVLPFINQTGDGDREYFSDGLSEDIIAALGRFSNLQVMSRNAVFHFKGQALAPAELSRELGVRYVVEGSVREAGDRVRVTVQLTDAARGVLLWSERYDRKIDDIFAVQDDITRNVAGALAIRLTRLEQDRAFARPTDNLDAYEHVLRGRQLLSRRSRSANFEARAMFERAIELDPNYSAAHLGLGEAYYDAALDGWTEGPHDAVQKAHDLLRKAIALDNTNAAAHAALSSVYSTRHQYDLAMSEIDRALALNPNDTRNLARRGSILLFVGRPEEAIGALEDAMRLDPNMGAIDLNDLGLAYYLEGRYDEAIKILEHNVSLHPDFVAGHAALAAAYAEAGRHDAAAREASLVRRLHPFFEVDAFGHFLSGPGHRDRVAEGLRKAGLE